MDFDNELMTITAIHDIAAGEELFINYNADPEDQSPIWFEAE
jgi:SET domain-containing protein